MSEHAHSSDCAKHNEPAYPNGPCDCGGDTSAIGQLVEDLIVARDHSKSNADRDTIARACSTLNEVARLRKALAGLVMFFSPPGENSLERFERIAAEFYRETGMLAPGKSEPAECTYQGRDEERRERYDRWVADRVQAARAALL